MQRIALVFDNTLRPETTGTYVRRALGELLAAGQLTQVEHFLPRDLPRIHPGQFDLLLAIDDGLDYDLPRGNLPVAWWAIDTHVSFARCLRNARSANWTFAAQRDGAQRLRQAGVAQAQWLPLACDPQIHGKHAVPLIHDLAFVGHVLPGERRRLLELLGREFPGTFIGQRYFQEMAATYSGSRIAFNRSVANDINMRVFEGLCSGSLLLTNTLPDNGLPLFFEDGVHCATYNSDAELLDKARYYLSHPEERERIAARGRAEVLAHHTYRQRVEALLGKITADSDSRQVTVPVSTNAIQSTEDNWLDQVEFAIKSFLRPQALLRLLRSIVEHYPAAQVTIVDDGNLWESPDPDSQACRDLITQHPRMQLETMPFDSGIATGRNQLIDLCSRPYVLLLDDDFQLTAQSNLRQLWRRLQQEPDLAVVAGMCWDVIQGQRAPRRSGGTLQREGRTLTIRTSHWHDEQRGLRDYVPQFALVRRAVFERCRWRGGLGAEHYDFCLQLQQHGLRVAQDLRVSVDHYPLTPALAGYRQRRSDVERWQQWLLETWNLDQVVQDDQVIIARTPPEPTPSSNRCRDPQCRCQGTCGGNCRCGKSQEQQNPRAPCEANSAASSATKDPTYFEFDRPDVLALVPTTAQRVLDIGCGGGRLGAAIKDRQPAHVTGIELNVVAATAARNRLDEVLEVDLASGELSFPTGSFDCVICADILEHLRDPLALLRNVRKWLTPDGTLVTSIPNVRNHAVLSSLLHGNWTYEAAGLLDEDHVRFFTRREVEKLIYRAGFELREMQFAGGPGTPQWEQAGRPRTVNLGSVQLTLETDDQAAELFCYQFLSVSTPRFLPESGLTSIILVTHNQWQYTKACLESLRLRTDEPYELIVVDNASTDGTAEYLRSCPDVRLILNDSNRGFPAAVNQGLAVAQGQQMLLLNNDSLVTTGWLSRMLRALQADASVGLVGPVSNNVSGEQKVAVSYRELADLDGFAWDWARSRQGQIRTTDRLVGFCLLIKRELIERIGTLDERFGIGNFEDDDYCRRALQAGYQAVIARDAFVHHFGSATFRASGIDHAGLLRENQRKFEEKWGERGESSVKSPVSSAGGGTRGEGLGSRENAGQLQQALTSGTSRAPAFLLSANDDGELELQPNGIQLSVCLIVRDNERTIRPCLESIAPWVDEIVVVDTGSLDRTPEICRELGARVFHWPWRDSFALARNESLRHARGQWVFWMDSDDTIPEECGRRLRQLAAGPHPDHILGYVAQVHCPGSDPHEVTAVDHIKLVRNRQDLEFEFRIHEQILPSIRRSGGEVAWSDIYVVHSGSEHSDAARARKHERDLRLLDLELTDRPDHPFVLFNLGMTYADAENHSEAERFLRQCLEVSPPQDSHVRKCYALLAGVLTKSEQFSDAERIVNQGLNAFPGDKELLFRLGMLQQNSGRSESAITTYQRLLREPLPRQFSSLDLGVTGFKCRHNLALAYEASGQLTAAADEWRKVIDEAPQFQAGWRCLVELLLTRGDRLGAQKLVNQFAERFPESPQRHLLNSRVLERQQQFPQARTELEQALALEPANEEFHQEYCRHLCHHGSPEEAVPALRALLKIAPENPANWHNLGVTHTRLEQFPEAAQAFERSLVFRPHHSDTQRQLDHCQQRIQQRQPTVPQLATAIS